MTLKARRLSLVVAILGVATLGARLAHANEDSSTPARQYLSQPLVTSHFTADPSAHVLDGRIYVYASHDTEEGPPLPDVDPFRNSEGNAFKMRDYVVLSMADPEGPVDVHSDVLDIANVPWASRQMWAPDAAYRNGTYYLYFPAKDHAGAFRIGVATSSRPRRAVHGATRANRG